PAAWGGGWSAARPQGRVRAVWLTPPPYAGWAVVHVIGRHGGRVETTVVLEVDVPAGWLRRSRKGLRYRTRDIPPDRIKRVLCFGELAGPSASGAPVRAVARPARWPPRYGTGRRPTD